MQWVTRTTVMSAIFLLTVLAAETGPAQARSLEEILATRELRVCVVPLNPAYTRFDDPRCATDCSVSGPVPRVVRAFTRTLGAEIRPVFHLVGWDEQFQDGAGRTDMAGADTPHLLETGRCDLYPNHLTQTEWRRGKMDFAILFLSRMMVIVRKERLAEFKSLKDLPGKTVGVVQNTSYHTWLHAQNQSVFANNPMDIRLLSPGTVLETVLAGAADFTVIDSDQALWDLTHRYPDLAVAFPVGPVDEIGWAFRKQDPELRDAAQAFFNQQVTDVASELNRIWKEEYGLTLLQLRALILATRLE